MSTAYGNNAHKKGRGALVDENLKRRFELNAGRARRNLRLWLVPRPSLKPLLKPDTDGMYHFESFQCQCLFGKMLPDLPLVLWDAHLANFRYSSPGMEFVPEYHTDTVSVAKVLLRTRTKTSHKQYIKKPTTARRIFL
jgi:hypothetical protein